MKNDIDNRITIEYKVVKECLRFIPVSDEIKNNLDLCLIAQHLKSYFDIKDKRNEEMKKSFKLLSDKANDILYNKGRLERLGWNGKDMFIFLVPGSTFGVSEGKPLAQFYREGTQINYHAHIDMKTADNKIVPWLASQTDLLADDWIEYQGETKAK